MTSFANVNGVSVSAGTLRVHSAMSGRVAGAYSVIGNMITFKPAADLKAGEKVHVTATQGITGDGGVTLTPRSWQFTAAVGGTGGGNFAGPAFGTTWTRDAVLGDVDGDGDLDAIIGEDGSTLIWLNDGSGVFTPHLFKHQLRGGALRDIATGDLDGDGDLDFVTANTAGGAEGVWLNDGSGGFAAGTAFNHGSSSTCVDLGDIDSDGDLDAVVGNENGTSVWINNGSGTFTCNGAFGRRNPANDLVMTDMDNDGDLDIVAIANTSENKVWLNDGTGAFSDLSYTSAPSGSEVVVGDVDEDNDIDVVTVAAETATVWLNSGSGTLSESGTFSAPASISSIAIGDVDADLDLDLICGNFVMLNNGGGIFTTRADRAIDGGKASSLELGDMDGDGDLDILVGEFLAGGVRAMLNDPAGDGDRVTVSDTLNTFDGSAGGNFSDVTKWSLGTVPAAGESFIIVGNCTFDNDAPGVAYATMTLGENGVPGVIAFAADNPKTLDVAQLESHVVGNGMDMTDGGLVQIRDDANLTSGAFTFTRGIGTVVFAGASVPELDYHHLHISRRTTSIDGTAPREIGVKGDLIVTGSVDIAEGTFRFENGATIRVLTGPPTTLNDVVIPAGASVSALTSFRIRGVFTVNGIFKPDIFTVISGGTTGSLAGTGTIHVTAINSVDSLPAQYVFSGTTGNLTVDFSACEHASSGCSPSFVQTISTPRTFHGLTIHTGDGVTISAAVVVTNTLRLNMGVATIAPGGTLKLTNTAPSSLAQGSGRVHGALTRAVTAGTYAFDVGTASAFLPVSVTVSSAPGPSSVTVAAYAGDPAAMSTAGLDAARSATGHWSIAPLNATLSGATFTFAASIDAGATPVAFVLRRFASSAWTHVPATSAPPSIAATFASSTSAIFATGNQALHHYRVSAGTSQQLGTTFTTTVVAQDLLNVQVPTTQTVSFSSSTGNAEFDADGNGTFGDATKALTAGQAMIATRDYVQETLTIIATDTNTVTGSSQPIVMTDPDVPPNFIATPVSTTSVLLSWEAVPSATSYEVWRTTSVSTLYSLVHTTAATEFTDTERTANTTFLYKVRGRNGTTPLPFSAVDAATTVIFTDATLTTSTTIKAAHLTELRTAVAAMRMAANLSDPTFTDLTISAGTTTVKATHITELRTALAEARSEMSLPAVTFTDTLVAGTTPIKKTHFEELRTSVK